MRGLAVLLVFLSHTSGRGMAVTPWLDFHGIGQIGVYLFFVLSGFLLTRNLLAGQRLSTYYVRRLFRILPLYAVVVTGVYLVQRTGHFAPDYLHIDDGVSGFVRHLLLVQGDGVFWTIPVEVTFYMVLPGLLLIGRRFRTGALALAALLYFLWFAGALRGPTFIPDPRVVDIDHAGQYLDVFLCGVVAAMVRDVPLARLAAPAFGLMLVITMALVAQDVLGFGRLWYGLRWISLAYGIVFGFAVWAAARGLGIFGAIFDTRVMRFVGTVGFGWYLLHMGVFEVINAYVQAWPIVKFLLAFAGCAVVSWLAYVAIERPFMALGRRLTQASPARALSTGVSDLRVP